MENTAAQEQTLSANQIKFSILKEALQKSIIGQEYMVDKMLIALLADGHILVEGAPGLAKTRAVNTLSKNIQGNFKRIQFTPDLLPSDLTGTEIFKPQTSEFEFRKGPLFNHLVLADEINRAPAKVQSALLEAMGERQISVAGQTYPLPELFLVMATQNPIEQEGTYPLPEAQLDRFLLHVPVDYPDRQSEKKILHCVRNEIKKSTVPETHNELSQESILAARSEVLNVHMSDQLEDYLIGLILATRNPGIYDEQLNGLLNFGASPRATLALDRCARAKAWLDGRDYVTPDDIQELFFDVVRHRVGLTYEADAKNLSKDQILNEILLRVAVP
jgi:MoxR-like ATPase